MLLLLFQLGKNRYAIDTADIVEVVPMMLLTKIPTAPAHIAGVFNYHRSIVPVVDLCQLLRGTSCQACYSTRVVIVNSIAGTANVEATKKGDRPATTHPIGLMAERVTETLKADPNPLEGSQQVNTVPYLSEPFLDEQGMIQQVHWQYLVSEAHQAALLTEGGNQANGAGRN